MKKLSSLFAIAATCMLMMAGCANYGSTTPGDLAGCCCTDKGKACAKADGPSSCGCPCSRCGKK